MTHHLYTHRYGPLSYRPIFVCEGELDVLVLRKILDEREIEADVVCFTHRLPPHASRTVYTPRRQRRLLLKLHFQHRHSRGCRKPRTYVNYFLSPISLLDIKVDS